MKNEQNNKLKMSQATLGCLFEDTNKVLWQGIVGIEEAVAETEEIVSVIIGASQKQSARNGFSAEKRGAKEVLLRAAFTVCCGLTALAAATNDAQLAVKSDFSRSDLAAGREQSVVDRCQALSDLGAANAAALAAKYNVNANDLKALKSAITNFTGAQSKPRQGRAISASATKQLEALFAKLDATLNDQLDPLMVKFQTTQPAFYSAYQTARSIVDSAASRESKVVPIPAPLAKAA